MPKHNRSPSIELKSINNDSIVIRYEKNEYIIYNKNKHIEQILDSPELFDCEIVEDTLSVQNLRHASLKFEYKVQKVV